MTTTADPQEVEQLRGRVRLYLGVMLLIDVFSYVSDAVTPLVLDDLKYPEMPPRFTLLRRGVTVTLAALWLLTRFARPGRLALGALESGVTLGLVWVYIHLALTYTSPVLPAYGPAFAMFGILLLLSVRASLVPSPVIRTVVIGDLLGREPSRPSRAKLSAPSTPSSSTG